MNQEKEENINYSFLFLKLPPTGFAGYTGIQINHERATCHENKYHN